MKHFTALMSILLVSLLTQKVYAQRVPIALHPENQHYFIYKGQPTILVGSGEHYGAVVNLDFDYEVYLRTLHKEGLNLTRLFCGSYIEPPGAFKISGNTLAPKANRYICPWARSDQPGYAQGGNRFDLHKWDEDYFRRLHKFMARAEKEGVIVELTLFCPFYADDQWNLSPMNARNNINGVGNVPRKEAYTLEDKGHLWPIQEALIRKIVSELKPYPNLIYEICNEPYWGKISAEWQRRVSRVISSEEASSGYHHLISQNIANGTASIQNADPLVSVYNFHYAYPPTAVSINYQLQKVIGDNETGFKGHDDYIYRREGWCFILAGGALYNNLDYSFSPGYETGNFSYPDKQPGGGSQDLRRQLAYLHKFIDRFNFLHMHPDSSIVVRAPEQGITYHALVDDAGAYALYLWGGSADTIFLRLPVGHYRIQWLNPETGKYQTGHLLQTGAAPAALPVPPYEKDIALRLIRRAN